MPSTWKRIFKRGQSGPANSIVQPVEQRTLPQLPTSPVPFSPTPAVQAPPNWQLFRDRGNHLLNDGKFKDAIVLFNTALEEHSSDVETLIHRSSAYSLSTPPDIARAMQDADTAIRNAPNNFEAWDLKGGLLQMKGDFQGAIDALENARGLAPASHRLKVQRDLQNARQALATSRQNVLIPSLVSTAANSQPPPTTDSSIGTLSGANANSLVSPLVPTAAASPTSPVSTRSQSIGSNPVSPIFSQSGSTSPITPNTVSSPTASNPVQKAPVVPVFSNRLPIRPVSVNAVKPTAVKTATTLQTTSSGVTGNVPAAQTSPSTIPLFAVQPPTQTKAPVNPPKPTQPVSGVSLNPNLKAPSPNPIQSSRAPTPTRETLSPSSTQGSAFTAPPKNPPRAPPVARAYNASTVPSSVTSALPLTSDLFGSTQASDTNDPPEYSESATPRPTNAAPITNREVETRLAQLKTALAARERGSLSIAPYTSGGFDAVKLQYVGMLQSELTLREMITLHFMHPSFITQTINVPHSTFADMDCESISSYDGKVPGTVSILGYSEEYRAHQLFLYPDINLVFESLDTFQPVTTDKLVTHVRTLQYRPTFEDDESLKALLGLSQIQMLQWGFTAAGTRQQRIKNLCMVLTRSMYTEPTRFIDFSKARTFSSNFFGTQGIGFSNFLFQIIIGAELLIRLRKEPAASVSFARIVTDSISSLMALSALWMQSVTIQNPTLGSSQWVFVANNHASQAEGLIRFAEAMAWPYMTEARNYIENVYNNLLSGHPTGFDMYDWLYGLVLPGKIFRHRIMCCLVYCSPTIRYLSGAPFYDNGLVVQGKSYWPKRSVLGRVLSGLRNPKSLCGWIGPLPAPAGNTKGWIRLGTRRIDIPTPVVLPTNILESLGFDAPTTSTETRQDILTSITNTADYIPVPPLTRPATNTAKTTFTGIELEKLPPTAPLPGALAHLPTDEHRAILSFTIASTPVRFTLFTNPVFIAAPPCVGTHLLHRRQVTKYLANTIQVAQLRDWYPEHDSLTVIDALGDGEEAAARAWCAERGRHAVVRRGEECCLACAMKITVGTTGTGVNVLIVSR